MSKKSFKDNPALAYLSNTQESAHESAQHYTHVHTQEVDAKTITPDTLPHIPSTDIPHENAESLPPAPIDPKSNLQRAYIRTQGRKGHKKPRINLAFDSDEFLNEIRDRAEHDGMSITQLVNEAVAYYLNNTK